MDTPQFNLFGEIVATDADKWFDSDVVPAMMVGWLNKQEGDVEININSPGGDVTAGLAIANAIKSYDKGKVTANVLGVAASMASVVACAADEVRMGTGAFLMIHNPWTVTMGDADALRHDAELLDKMRDSIVAFYQSKTTADADALKALMDAESWLTFDELTANGFTVSALEEEFKAAACISRRAFDSAPEAAHRFYTTVPADWAKRFAGLQGAKDKEIATARDAAAALQAENETLRTRNDELTAAADQVRADLEQAHAEQSALQADNEKLSADIAEKAQALETANADLEQLRAKLGEAETELAETQAALDAETKRYREQVGLAMQPPEDLPTFEEGLAKCATPAEKSAFIASGKYKKH